MATKNYQQSMSIINRLNTQEDLLEKVIEQLKSFQASRHPATFESSQKRSAPDIDIADLHQAYKSGMNQPSSPSSSSLANSIPSFVQRPPTSSKSPWSFYMQASSSSFSLPSSSDNTIPIARNISFFFDPPSQTQLAPPTKEWFLEHHLRKKEESHLNTLQAIVLDYQNQYNEAICSGDWKSAEVLQKLLLQAQASVKASVESITAKQQQWNTTYATSHPDLSTHSGIWETYTTPFSKPFPTYWVDNPLPLKKRLPSYATPFPSIRDGNILQLLLPLILIILLPLHLRSVLLLLTILKIPNTSI